MIQIILACIAIIPSTATLVVNCYQNKKIDKIKELKINVDKVRLENDKTYLTDFLSEIEAGQPKTEIQKKRAYEVYEEYTKLNGNSYVHNKWEELVKREVL